MPRVTQPRTANAAGSPVRTDETALRDLLARILDWQDAHVSFDAAVKNMPAPLRGKRPAKVPYSPWQLLEHLRITQHDILEFCRNAQYAEMKWPDDYWPADAAPPSGGAWTASIRRFREDREALRQLAFDPSVRLDAVIPHGSGQTYLREILLAADHAAYHVGQIVVVRKLLGCWK
jgi:hypothetical protein